MLLVYFLALRPVFALNNLDSFSAANDEIPSKIVETFERSHIGHRKPIGFEEVADVAFIVSPDFPRRLIFPRAVPV